MEAKSKEYRHYDFTAKTGPKFFPIAFDSSGHLDKRSLEALKMSVRLLTITKEASRSAKTAQLYEALSVALHRGNALMVNQYRNRAHALSRAPAVGRARRGTGSQY